MSTLLAQLDANGRAHSKRRPSFPRSNSSPSWPKNLSLESLSSSLTPLPPNTTAPPPLRKRHSAYVLSPSQNQSILSTTPILVTPPKRPLRNPARLAIPPPPTIQTGSDRQSNREDITPWEFVTPNFDHRSPSETSSAVSAPKSRQLLSTGPVSEVTPWELYPVSRSATSGSMTSASITTGTIEEVTPWELHPVPSVMPVRTTLSTGPIEEVTPWELAPAPPLTQSKSIGGKQSSPRPSTSSSQNRSFADIAHIGRRKKTSAGPQKSRSNTVPGPILQKSNSLPVSSDFDNITSTPKRPNRVLSTPTTAKPARPSVPPLGLVAAATSDAPSNSPQPKLKFSTADRTILEELKRNIKARELQFVLKGDESSLRRALGPHGKRHHAFPRDEVPYPRNFERNVIDLDVWETAFCREVCDGLTWHVFETPPAKVLDIGCGTGTWILDCARSWKESHFVGLDIVPLQPELHQVGSSDLASRITWVHTNFLEGLPFPNDDFDFVHVKRIALGVPEDKWDFLFEEISRILKPGGAFQMLEEDLFFPGRSVDNDGDSESTSLSLAQKDDSERSRRDSNVETIAKRSSRSSISHRSDVESPSTPTTFSDTLSRSHSPIKLDTPEEMTQKEEAQELLAQVIGEYTITPELPSAENEPPVSDTFFLSTVRQLPHDTTPPHRSRALSDMPARLVHTRSTVSLTTNGAAPGPPQDVANIRTRPRGVSLSTTLSTPVLDTHRPQNPSPLSPVFDQLPSDSPAIGESQGDLPSLVRTEPKAPINPRDHSLLELIYTHLLESRFINLHPLALLANSIGLYFRDVRTHPPLQYSFPAAPQKASEPKLVVEENGDLLASENYNSDSDDARDAIVPSPVSRVAKGGNSRRMSSQSYDGEASEKVSEDHRYVDVRSLLHRTTPYITLDVSRSSALSPSLKGMFPGVSSTKVQRSSFLPNTTMNIDLRSLNLHLALRVAEIIACSESMWEWVLQYQAKARRGARASVGFHRLGSGSLEMDPRVSVSSTSSRYSSDSLRTSLLQLDRSGFDDLLRNFEMDMHDNYSLGSCLGERFSWFPIFTEISHERERFEEVCKAWDEWVQQQSTPASSSTSVISHNDAAQHNGSSERTMHGKLDKDMSKSSSQLQPAHRMSRVMRVFVGWKALHH